MKPGTPAPAQHTGTSPAADIDAIILSACAGIVGQGRHADAVLQHALRTDPGLTAEDKSRVATAVFDIVRYARFLGALTSGDPASIPLVTTATLDAWRLWRGMRPPLGTADLEMLERAAAFSAIRALRESLPDWLDQAGMAGCGDRWEKLLSALNSPPQQVLRANTLKTTASALLAEAARMGFPGRLVEWAPAAVVLEGHAPVFQWDCFRKGWFELQDAASQAVAAFMEVRPGMRVVDGCAGHGGKTLHLAALMENRGRIIALDSNGEKLAVLEHRARRAGAQIIETRAITSTKIIKRLAGSADRLLLDVPCSGTGVWRRNPDAKWHLQPEELPRLQAKQQQILSYYSRMVKPGGRLVYATCSVLPAEGEEQVARFLAGAEGAFSLSAEQRLDPDTHGFDGFYMAALERTSS